MSDNSKRRAGNINNGPPTVIAEGAVMQGDIRTPGALMLSGSICGDGDVGGRLSIAKGAHWEGRVKSREAVVAGNLTGTLTVEGKLEVGAQAVIRGRVSAKVLAIAQGAVIEGDIQVTSDASVVQLEEVSEAVAG
jgi:cytoskeletal protein CcmA (bactofilin family)